MRLLVHTWQETPIEGHSAAVLLFLGACAIAAAAASPAEYQSAVARSKVEIAVEGLQRPSGKVFLPDGLICFGSDGGRISRIVQIE